MTSKWDAGEKEIGASSESTPTGSKALLFWSVLAIVAAGVFAYLLFFSPRHEARLGREHAAVGTHLAGLSLMPLTGDGKPVSLQDLKGQVVLVNYWGTWCPPCQAEFPQLAALEKGLRKEAEFRYLSVSCGAGSEEDEDELKAATEGFLRSRQVDHPTWFDADGKSRVALVKSARLKDFGYPTTVLLDRDGVIRALWLGFDSRYDAEMHVAVREVLKEGK